MASLTHAKGRTSEADKASEDDRPEHQVAEDERRDEQSDSHTVSVPVPPR